MKDNIVIAVIILLALSIFLFGMDYFFRLAAGIDAGVIPNL